MQLEVRYTQGTALFHAGSYQGYTDGILQGRIDDRAKGNIGSVIYGLSNSFGDLVDFKERHIVAATDIEEHAAGTTDTHIEKTTCNGLLCRDPSKVNGRVTIPMVRAPNFLAMEAITGAAPVPVPPPIPAAMNTRSASPRAARISAALSVAARIPVAALPPAPRPLVKC